MNNLTIKPNEKQLICINNIEGKYLVLAGPGTGKTFTLIERIKFMLNRGIKEEKILCLTFSDIAAREIRQRLEKELNRTNIQISIFTYHSFCNEIINENFSDFDLAQNYRIISKSTSRQFIKEIIDEINPIEYRSSKNDPYIYIGTILNQIEEIKKNRLTKEKYFNNIEKNPDWKPKIKVLEEKLLDYQKKDKKIPNYLLNSIETQKKKIQKALELWDFYENYKNKMEKNHFIDFYDMINLVLEKFEFEPSFLHSISNKFDYFLVDEYQDTNKSQNQIILDLINSNDKKNIFLVGDDDQIIFTFQGAKKNTIENFLSLNPDTKVICLKDNMRSTKNILSAARGIIIQDSTRLELNPEFSSYNISKELIAKNESLVNKKIELNRFCNTNQEYNAIVDRIEEIINSPDCPRDKTGKKDLSQIAILTKTNPELDRIAKKLKNKNIPYELKEGGDIFESKAVVVLYYYLKMLQNPAIYSDCIFKLLLLEPFNINNNDFCLLYQKKSNNKSFIDSMRETEGFLDKEKIDNFLSTYDYLKNYMICESLDNIILETGAKTGIFDYYFNCETNKTENILSLKKFVQEAKDFLESKKNITLYDFLEYLDICLVDEIPIKTEKPPFDLNAVQLTTYHSSKGREFEYVFLPTLMRNLWEADLGSNKPTIPLDIKEYKTEEELSIDKLTDRIKLLYVGFTRAKHTLILSYTKTLNDKEKPISQLILNIKDLLVEQDFSDLDEKIYIEESKKSLHKKTYDYKRDFSSFIDNILAQKNYSISSVNLYLKCPRQYLYSNILDLSSKFYPADSMHYGSAIHSALEYSNKFVLENKKHALLDKIIEVFSKELKKYPLSTLEQKQIHLERGQKALRDYYSQITTERIEKIQFVEYPIIVSEKDYTFKGIIDRIDKNEDGTYSIIDYKTGSPKTKSAICLDGKKEDYFIQIALYKYFFEKYSNCKVRDVNLVFVESKDNNLNFELVQAELEAALEKFHNAINRIKNHEFEPNYNKEVCKYCKFKDFCHLEVL